jgi:N-dimethylarginine dimethylaminohydrolase
MTGMGSVDLYLMSPPGPRWALRGRANFRSQSAAEVDAGRALGEWLSLADAIEQRGGRVVCLVPPDDTELTGLPYAAECGQIVEGPAPGPYLFLLPTMGAAHREGERALWGPLAASMGLRPVSVEGTWEAQGDVATFLGRTLLFFGGRTDRRGAESAARHFHEPLLIEVRQPAFHGNMAVLPLEAGGKLLACPSVITSEGWARLAEAFGRERLLEVSEGEIRSYATNGLPIGREVLAPHLLPRRVRGLIEQAGLSVVELSMVELCEKAGGASRCLVSWARVDERRVSVPPEHDYRARRAELAARAQQGPPLDSAARGGDGSVHTRGENP